MYKQLACKRLNRLLSILFEKMRYLTDDDRDLPMRWSMMHMYSSSQVIKVLAFKRGLNIELAGIIAALHDYGLVISKSRINHSRNALEPIRALIASYNEELRLDLPRIEDEELDIILQAVNQHSNKGEFSDNEYVELIKDADALDRYLHGIKTESHHLTRLNRVMKELNLEENTDV